MINFTKIRENNHPVNVDPDLINSNFIKYFNQYCSTDSTQMVSKKDLQLLDSDVKHIISKTSLRYNSIDFNYIYQNYSYAVFENIKSLFESFFTIDPMIYNELEHKYKERNNGSLLCWGNNMSTVYVNSTSYPLYRSIVNVLIDSLRLQEHLFQVTSEKDYLEDLLIQFNLKKPLTLYFKPTNFKLSTPLFS